MRTHRLGPLALLVFALPALGGCGKLRPVEGVVTLDGAPLPAATIIFHAVKSPENQAGGLREASAMTDKDGKFRLETRSKKGALEGSYKITVSRRVLPPGVKPPENVLEAMAVETKKVETVPAPYLSIDTTTLLVEVPKGGRKDVEIQLETISR